MSKIHFYGDTAALFQKLDIDGSGEILIDEIDLTARLSSLLFLEFFKPIFWPSFRAKFLSKFLLRSRRAPFCSGIQIQRKLNQNDTKNASGGTCARGAKRPRVGVFPRCIFGFIFVLIYV